MTVRHHPDETLLLAYAAGSQDVAMALILATHLSLCPHCRALLTVGERIGGALLDGIPPVALADDALARTMARLEAPETPKPMVRSGDGTPAPLRAFLGRDLADVRWRRMGPRLAYATLYRRGPLAMRLLRGAPGTDVGCHTHRGEEFTLVLRGGYTDETGRYGPGDFQAATSELMHNPVADADEDCINLAVTVAGLRFRSRTQTLLARLFGF